MRDEEIRAPGFEVVHFGINCPDGEAALTEAEAFFRLFGLPVKDGRDSVYAGPLIELMKGNGRGSRGHIAVGVDDIEEARIYLEKQGREFDNDSCKYDEDGNLIVIYLKGEIAGFALHLLQKERKMGGQKHDSPME